MHVEFDVHTVMRTNYVEIPASRLVELIVVVRYMHRMLKKMFDKNRKTSRNMKRDNGFGTMRAAKATAKKFSGRETALSDIAKCNAPDGREGEEVEGRQTALSR